MNEGLPMKIALCDSNLSDLQRTVELLEQYRKKRGCELECAAYHSPFDLMTAVERGHRWDLLFLETLMPGEDGITLARELRNLDQNMKIVFLTASSHYAVQSYTVGAVYYQLKPICREDFFPMLDRVLELVNRAHEKKLVLNCKTGILTLSPAELEYCEIMGRNLTFHLRSGRVLEGVGSLGGLEEKLQSLGSFLRVHRAYLLNMAYVQKMSYRGITMACGTVLPVPRGRYGQVRQRYLAYAAENELVLEV